MSACEGCVAMLLRLQKSRAAADVEDSEHQSSLMPSRLASDEQITVEMEPIKMGIQFAFR